MDLEVEGRRISVAESGNGEPVVLVHSSGLGGAQWRRVVDALSPRFRLLVPDLVGYGESDPWPAGERSAASSDRAVVAAVVAAAGAAVHVVGHSYGGLLALQVALEDRRGAIRTLALYEPVAFGVLRWALPPAEAASFLGQVEEAFGGARADAVAFVARLVDYWNGPGVWEALDASRRRPFLENAAKVRDEVRSLIHAEISREALAGLHVPTLLLSGGRTRDAATRICEVLAEALPRAGHVVLEDAGHMGPVTHADVVAPLLAERFATR